MGVVVTTVAKSNSEYVTLFPQIDVDAFGFFHFVWFGLVSLKSMLVPCRTARGKKQEKGTILRCFVQFSRCCCRVCLGVSTKMGLNEMNGVQHT